MIFVGEAGAVIEANGDIAAQVTGAQPDGRRAAAPPGSESGARAQGLPRNLGDPCRLVGERSHDVALNEGNEGKREGRKEVGVPR